MAATPDSASVLPEAPDTGTRLSQTGRVEAFSDGVMAIAITLLVLDLKVPSEAETREAGSLIGAIAQHWPSYLAYLAAFLTIGIIWLNHRAFVDKIRRFDNRLHWQNLALLLGVATLPFPTALLAAYLADGGAPASTAAVIYGLLSVATALPWLLMWRHILRHPQLLEPPYGPDHARAELRRASIGPMIYLLAVPLAIVLPLAALLFYLSVGAVYAFTNQGVQALGREPE